eukprot:6344483-Lingulodinium_polyedra.AAC.1
MEWTVSRQALEERQRGALDATTTSSRAKSAPRPLTKHRADSVVSSVCHTEATSPASPSRQMVSRRNCARRFRTRT